MKVVYGLNKAIHVRPIQYKDVIYERPINFALDL